MTTSSAEPPIIPPRFPPSIAEGPEETIPGWTPWGYNAFAQYGRDNVEWVKKKLAEIYGINVVLVIGWEHYYIEHLQDGTTRKVRYFVLMIHEDQDPSKPRYHVINKVYVNGNAPVRQTTKEENQKLKERIENLEKALSDSVGRGNNMRSEVAKLKEDINKTVTDAFNKLDQLWFEFDFNTPTMKIHNPKVDATITKQELDQQQQGQRPTTATIEGYEVCSCGHTLMHHDSMKGRCYAYDRIDDESSGCGCTRFVSLASTRYS